MWIAVRITMTWQLTSENSSIEEIDSEKKCIENKSRT